MNSKVIEIEGKTYNYRFRKSKKSRHIRLQISEDNGIELIAPKYISEQEAMKFINSNKEWLNKKIADLEKKRNKFYFLGREITVFQQYDMFRKTPSVNFTKNQLIISTPVDEEIDLKTEYNNWLKQKAKIYIPRRTEKLADQYDLKFGKISIRSQKTRWGSCSAKKTLSFNSKLMMLNKRLIDYVIIHELCHTREMNHSKHFWCLVESIMPDYYSLRKQLKKHNF